MIDLAMYTSLNTMGQHSNGPTKHKLSSITRPNNRVKYRTDFVPQHCPAGNTHLQMVS